MDEITPEIVDRIRAYLSDSQDSSDVWRGLLFMEANGIDVALRSTQLHAYLSDPCYSPIPDARSLSAEQERLVLLEVRAELRRELGMAPLTGAERKAWRYEPQRPFAWPRGEAGPWRRNFDHAQRQAFLGALEAKRPGLISALRRFAEYNTAISHDDAAKLSTEWLYHDLLQAVYALGEAMSDLDAHHLVLQIQDDLYGERE
jgi:hypothetical protein